MSFPRSTRPREGRRAELTGIRQEMARLRSELAPVGGEVRSIRVGFDHLWYVGCTVASVVGRMTVVRLAAKRA